MAASTPSRIQSDQETESPEQPLCAIFDVVEDALDKLSPEKRQAWLGGLSATAEKLEKQA